ncbi:DsbA family protein [Stackebrandtia soli]|uniref:DsbA family protein n=1 Tax=Stackebrandtia soli TaxID=1892856 RepID=UPI0039EC379C
MTTKKARRAGQRHRPKNGPPSKARSNGAKASRALAGGGMSLNTKLTIGLVAFLAVVVTAVLVFTDKTPEAVAADARLVRADSHTLSTAEDEKVTIVEFLDFECEACGALYPSTERILTEYDGRITFVVRYFPLPGHANGEPAARAVEAAAAQGKFDEMYRMMFENQASWGERQTSQESVFLGFAEELDLDLAEFEATMNDPATADRVAKDVSDGMDLNVTGTPTLFLNGELLDARSYADLKLAIDEALEA